MWTTSGLSTDGSWLTQRSSFTGHRHSMFLPPDGRVVPDGVFDLAQAQAAGWSLAALRHAITVGRIRRVRRGMYIGAEPVGSSAFARRELVAVNNAVAAMKAVRGSTISHRSAALWHGLPVLDAATPCVTVAPGRSPNQPSVHIHRARLSIGHIDRVARVPVTDVPRTIVDLGREHGFDESVVAADAALRNRTVSLTGLNNTLYDCRGWPGTRAARAAIAFSDRRSESVLESLSRVQIHRFDLPAPELQAEIRDRSGRFVARVDFLFDEWGVVGEADGLEKYAIHGVEEHEQRRRQRIENLGYAFVRWQYADLGRFEIIADRIRHAARHRFVGGNDPWRPVEATDPPAKRESFRRAGCP